MISFRASNKLLQQVFLFNVVFAGQSCEDPVAYKT